MAKVHVSWSQETIGTDRYLRREIEGPPGFQGESRYFLPIQNSSSDLEKAKTPASRRNIRAIVRGGLFLTLLVSTFWFLRA